MMEDIEEDLENKSKMEEWKRIFESRGTGISLVLVRMRFLKGCFSNIFNYRFCCIETRDTKMISDFARPKSWCQKTFPLETGNWFQTVK